MRKFLPLCLAVALLSCAKSQLVQEGERVIPAIKVYALRYGVSKFPAESIFHGDTSGRLQDFHWLCYLILAGERVILVDTGFNDAGLIQAFKIQHRNVTDILGELDIRPDMVTDILITHAHFDHIGGIDQFPKARLFISTAAYAWFIQHPSIPTLKEHLLTRQGVVQFSGELAISPAIQLIEVGGHAQGSSVVKITINGTSILLTGDEAYLPRNVEEGIPVGTVLNLETNRTFLQETKAVHMPFFTFHDPTLVTGEAHWKQVFPVKE